MVFLLLSGAASEQTHLLRACLLRWYDSILLHITTIASRVLRWRPTYVCVCVCARTNRERENEEEEKRCFRFSLDLCSSFFSGTQHKREIKKDENEEMTDGKIRPGSSRRRQKRFKKQQLFVLFVFCGFRQIVIRIVLVTATSCRSCRH